MRRLAALAALLLPTSALAQQIPEAAQMDLWCGLAFTVLAEDAPDEAPAELVARFAEAGKALTDRASAAYLENGFSEQALVARRETILAEARSQLDSAELADTYSFEECSALLPF